MVYSFTWVNHFNRDIVDDVIDYMVLQVCYCVKKIEVKSYTHDFVKFGEVLVYIGLPKQNFTKLITCNGAKDVINMVISKDN